jgi:hypothetical protein
LDGDADCRLSIALTAVKAGETIVEGTTLELGGIAAITALPATFKPSSAQDYAACACDRSEYDKDESKPRLATQIEPTKLGMHVVRRVHGKLPQAPHPQRWITVNTSAAEPNYAPLFPGRQDRVPQLL